MKNLILSIYLLLISLFSCERRTMIENDSYNAHTYATWSKVGEVDFQGKETVAVEPNQLFNRTWSGWTLTQPHKGLDSIYFQKDNRVVYRDRVAKTDKTEEKGRFYIHTDKGMQLEIKFIVPDEKNSIAYLYVSRIQNDSIVKGGLDKYIFIKSTN
ncbi:hypothetical protein [Runella salmonicolor]|uniref:Lipocalin-like domain-containing protein n=1 Tax=Runella salmonicolor TaxID=2950278 RepID=A0ABT1FY13_9BACT|nr:hypothetical protein [Runella salmonicolor]MCP1386360.1 hypothetical protein [Runella salmonicolor]